jgi:hypothetical protein
MQYNRFDLWGGELSPELAEGCDNSKNECKGMIS